MSSQKRKGYILIPSPRIPTAADDEAAPAQGFKGCLLLVLQSHAKPLYSRIHVPSPSQTLLCSYQPVSTAPLRYASYLLDLKSQWLSTPVIHQTEWLACFTPCSESPGP